MSRGNQFNKTYRQRFLTRQPATRTRIISIVLLCCLLFCAACANNASGSVQSKPTGEASATILPSPGTENLEELLQTEQAALSTALPASDLYSLAQRLSQSVDQIHDRTVRTEPLNESVGHEQSFWIFNQDTQSYSQIQARLEYLTDHVYMYVQDNQPFNQTALQQSTDTFEQQIYPQTRASFGSEWSPGIDDDVHLTILNAIALGQQVGGSFLVGDEYPNSVNPHSNQREMFYMNLDAEIPGSVDYASAMTSQLQQLIAWHNHPLNLDWFSQGNTILARALNSYSVEGVDRTFQQHPDTQLTAWPGDSTSHATYAGASYLFLAYFADHYGKNSTILQDLLADPALPPTSFDNVLKKHGYSEDFNDIVNDWLVANFVQDPRVADKQYGYSELSQPAIMPQHTVSGLPFSESDQVNQYAAEYYDFQPKGNQHNLNIQISGAPTTRMINNDPDGDSYEWWGNRANNLDSTLTRAVDLSNLKGQHATLQFAAWYELQQDHDYAYVEVSTDGGTRWTTLQGIHTTADNPDGLNWGNGFTGVSGDGTTPDWTQESVDLTPYTGQKILLRFEEVTDQSINLQGFALDQVRIPEINFQDNLSSDNGWTSQGFIRSNNILPEHYQVQAIVYTGSAFTVQPLSLDLASGQGNLTIPLTGAGVTRIVLVVSAFAPVTTLPAHYQINLRTT